MELFFLKIGTLVPKWLGYKDKGLLGEANGQKIGSNVIILPKENQQKIIEFMYKEKIAYSIKEIYIS